MSTEIRDPYLSLFTPNQKLNKSTTTLSDPQNYLENSPIIHTSLVRLHTITLDTHLRRDIKSDTKTCSFINVKYFLSLQINVPMTLHDLKEYVNL